ncbi:MAG: zf-HC2 domain-containing protein [Candidatus Polarisedimenticolia bacterium]
MSGPRSKEHPFLLPWYRTGRLDAEEERDIRQHLEVCAECAETSPRIALIAHHLRAVAAPHVGSQELVDFEGGRSPDPALRARIEAHLAACHDCRGDLEALRSASMKGHRRPGRRWLPAAAAILLLSLAAPAAWRWWNASPAAGGLWLPARRSVSDQPVLSSPGPWPVTIQLPASAPQGTYRARVLDESGRELATIGPAVRPDASGRLGIEIPPLPSPRQLELALEPEGSAQVSYTYRFRTAP